MIDAVHTAITTNHLQDAGILHNSEKVANEKGFEIPASKSDYMAYNCNANGDLYSY